MRRAVTTFLAFLCAGLYMARPAGAVEPKDLVGYWEGTVEGQGFPEPSKVLVEMWMTDGKIEGIQGNIYGVSKLDAVTFKDGKLTVVFYLPQVGPAILSGDVNEQKIFYFNWQVGDGRGTGEVHWVNPASVKPIKDEQVSGTYYALAWGPMTEENFSAQVDLKIEKGKVTGRISAPHGIFTITEGVYKLNRLRLICRSEDDVKVLVVGTAGAMGLDIFWTVDFASGRAVMFKK